MSANDLKNRASAEWLANAFKEVDWLIPAYIQLGYLNALARAIENAPQNHKLEILQRALNQTYNEDYLSVMLLERYRKVPYVRDFGDHIDQAIKAFFSNYKLVAVAAMIPVLEGVIRKIATRNGRSVGFGTKNLNLELDSLVQREAESPHCYGERLVMLETLRDFVRDRLLANTEKYAGQNEFNRHGILHGIFSGYGEEINFFRAITILDLLCFSVGLIEGGVSAFAPETTEESSALAAQYRRLAAI